VIEQCSWSPTLEKGYGSAVDQLNTFNACTSIVTCHCTAPAAFPLTTEWLSHGVGDRLD